MAVSYGDGHPQWEKHVTHEITDIVLSDLEISIKNKLTNLISGALKSPVGEFPLDEFYYLIGDKKLGIYDRNASLLIEAGIGSFDSDEIEWVRDNLPLFNTSEEYQDESKIKLEFKKWKNEWWNVFRTNGTQIDLIGYIRPLLPHLILPFDIESDGPTPRHYFEDRYDRVIVTEPEKKLINEFIMRQVGDISVQEISTTPDSIDVYVLESLYLNVKLKPTYATNLNYTIASSDDSVAYIDSNNVVNGQSEGTCNIIISTEEVDKDGNPLLTKLVPVKVLQLYELINTIYPIKKDGEGRKYITKISADTRVSEFVDSFRNNNIYLQILDTHGNDVTHDSVEIVKTGMTVDLIINGNICDHLDVVVPGDVNGDGLISSNDLTVFNKHYSNVEKLTYPYTIAADINEDNVINTEDRSMLINFINTGRF